jgi:hypothetical protein
LIISVRWFYLCDKNCVMCVKVFYRAFGITSAVLRLYIGVHSYNVKLSTSLTLKIRVSFAKKREMKKIHTSWYRLTLMVPPMVKVITHHAGCCTFS